MLEQRGYVTDKTAAEERQHVRRWAELFHKYNKAFSPGFMFLVSYDCNFRCPYCYEGGISGDGRHWTQQRFSKELVDKAYQAMEQIEPRKERQGHVITLYGGEPLMKENKEIVNYILEQGKKNGFYFNAITNGYDLECYEEWLGPDMINFLQITLDGDQKMHDSRRFHHQTGHSFEKIYRNIKMALDKDIRVSIRFNADANNLRYVKILEEMFRKSGYTDYKKFDFHVAMLIGDENITPDGELTGRGPSLTAPNGIAYLSRKEFNKQHESLGLSSPHQDYGTFQRLYNAISQKDKLVSFRSVFCGVQTSSYIFDPYGEIYSCWETVGVRKHVMGSYTDGLVWTEEREHWQGRNIGNTPKCSACRYALLCGGGCMAKALRSGGDYSASYCDEYPDTFAKTANQVYEKWLQDQSRKTEITV